MKVFISWSGTQSNYVASALRGWLLDVLPAVEPFMSEHDIELGERWSPEIARRLDESGFGLVIVTRHNYQAPWLNFEAGAISKALDGDAGTVVPIFYDISSSDIRSPLTQFQYMEWSQEKALELIKRMNALTEHPRPEERIVRAFEHYWPDLEGSLRTHDAAFLQSEQGSEPQPDKRDSRDLLDEALDLLRGLDRHIRGSVMSATPGAAATASPSTVATSASFGTGTLSSGGLPFSRRGKHLVNYIRAAMGASQLSGNVETNGDRVTVELHGPPNKQFLQEVERLEKEYEMPIEIQETGPPF